LKETTFLTVYEKDKEVIVVDSLIAKEKIDDRIAAECNFVFPQQLFLGKKIRNGLIRIAFSVVVSICLSILSIIEFKPLNRVDPFYILLFYLHLGLLITIIVSLEDISTAYSKKRVSPTKMASIIGAVLGLLFGIFSGYALLQNEFALPPVVQKPISIFMLTFLTISLAILLISQIIGFLIVNFMKTSKRYMKIINSLVVIFLVSVSYVYLFYFQGIISDVLLVILPIIFILVDCGLFAANVFVFKKHANYQIIITPLRIIWIEEHKIDYYRFKEISKIEAGKSIVILSIKGGFHVVKNIRIASQNQSEELLQLFRAISQSYLTKAHTELRAEQKRKDT